MRLKDWLIRGKCSDCWGRKRWCVRCPKCLDLYCWRCYITNQHAPQCDSEEYLFDDDGSAEHSNVGLDPTPYTLPKFLPFT